MRHVPYESPDAQHAKQGQKSAGHQHGDQQALQTKLGDRRGY
jgi:hypothetical protein